MPLLMCLLCFPLSFLHDSHDPLWQSPYVCGCLAGNQLCLVLASFQVADFGLSLKMDHMETHISSVWQGTM